MALTFGNIRVRVPAILLLTVPTLMSAPAQADEESDPLSLLAGYSVQHESNLFRRPEGSDPVIDGQRRQRSDVKQVARLGFSLQQRFSNQDLQLGAVVTRNAYSEFDFLDFTGLNYGAKWNGQIGRWLGALTASQTESERSFADSLSTARSVNTARTYSASVDLRVRGEWKIGLGFSALRSRYDDFSSTSLDFDQSNTDARLALRTANDNELALILRDTQGRSPNRVDTQIVDDEYHQREVRLDGRYRFAGRSVFSGYVGVARRTYPDTPFRDYSGVIGRLSYELMLTSKLRGGLGWRRELGAIEDLVDNYVITTAINVNLSFDISSKITAKLLREELRRNFKGDPGLQVLPSDGEQDGQATYATALVYAPLRNLEIDLVYRRDTRTDESVAADFRSSTVRLGARLKL